VRPFRFALAPLLEARAQEKEAARAAHAAALTALAALDRERDALCERQATLRAAVARHALSSGGATLRAACAALESFDEAFAGVALRRRPLAADTERTTEALREATVEWKRVDVLAANARRRHEGRVRLTDERERDESNMLR
jgi:hypothetical protein